MNDTSWTPGPWYVPKARGYAHGPVDKNDVPVVTWTGMARPRQENGMANAHLIAAAPDLYDALLLAMQSIHPGNGTDLAVCNAALAKARGES